MEKSEVLDLERRFEERLRSDPSALASTDVADRVLEAAGAVRNLELLDAGCGTGELCRRLSDRGALVSGIDLCAGLVERARSMAPLAALARADAQALPFGTARFDLATSVLVLHYLENPGRALAELARVLRPGGRLIVCDRICSADPVLRAAQIGVERLRNPLIQRILSSDELEELLRGAGFEVSHQVEFRRAESLEAWVAGTDPRWARAVREEIARLRGRDLGGFRVVSGDRVELRMALVECRRTLADSK
jgi:ubiquinone/menaquinone biosynthesis C-methylase UbiE